MVTLEAHQVTLVIKVEAALRQQVVPQVFTAQLGPCGLEAAQTAPAAEATMEAALVIMEEVDRAILPGPISPTLRATQGAVQTAT